MKFITPCDSVIHNISAIVDVLAVLKMLWVWDISGVQTKSVGKNLVVPEKMTNTNTTNNQTRLLKFPEGRVFNVAWGSMPVGRLRWLQDHQPSWWREVIWFLSLGIFPHPYAKYACTD